MFYYFLYPLADSFPFFNLFRYITFRTGGALLTSLFLSFYLGPSFIDWLKKKQKEGQPIRKDGPESHHITKKGTPTMGGVLILVSLSISVFLWGRLDNLYLWIVMLVTLGFGSLGAMDDYLKLTYRTSQGMSGKVKIVCQISIALGAVYALIYMGHTPLSTSLAVPFFKDFFLNLGWFFLPFGAFVIVGASNAVNLTDGLDGLAIVPVMIAAGCFLLIAYLVGNVVFAHYLHITYVPRCGELAIFCGALVGGSLGFLWYNAPPALVFMGDTGSLSLGGALGTISLVTKHELVLALIGGVFVMETISVILQVVYFKITGQRIFLMAPIHHHFEKKGWAESTIVIRFWIMALVLGLIGLSTLKLR